MEPSKPKNRAPAGKAPAAPAKNVPPPPAPVVQAKIPPLFRKIDWITMLIAFGVVWFVYYLTLAPEVTLEDSGELCTGAFYAGIPHPPGYPFWAIYSWFWCHLLPLGNVAWRVEMGESFGAAMGCGMVALMISRGSSMLIEGIEDFKGLAKKHETAICMVCGSVVGIMLGMGGPMWSESDAINRISLFGVPWVVLAMVCVLRWIYAPRQLRYLLAAMFIFGICTTIHQTLLCAGIGLQVAIAATNKRLGREFFLWDSFLFVGGLIAYATHNFPALNNVVPEVRNIFLTIGLASVGAYVWFAIWSRESFNEFCRDGSLAAAFLLIVWGFTQHLSVFYLLALVSLGSFVYFAIVTWKLGCEWLTVFCCGMLVIAGAAFYLWEPISGMTNPPMDWAYPRTVEGWFHALSRGQYDQAHPTDVFNNPAHFIMQLGLLASGIAEDFNWVMLLVALVPFFYFLKMQKRERSWIIGVGAVYLCVGVLLVILMNPSEDKSSVDLHRVFFTSSHAIVGILIGYGLALTTAAMVVNYQKFRATVPFLAAVALLPALMTFYGGISSAFFANASLENYNHRFGLFLLIAGAFILAGFVGKSLWNLRNPATVTGDPQTVAIFCGGGALLCLIGATWLAFFDQGPSLAPLGFGEVLGAVPRALSARLANLPALAGMLILALTVAFLAAILIFRERAPLSLVLGLFAVLPVSSAMSHWGNCEQRDHWFGYWFGHDMFTPPFTGPDKKLSYDPNLRRQVMAGPDGNLTYPEMTTNTVLFGGTDPGRFCPTYMVFCESFIPHKDQPEQDQHFDRRDVYIITQNALADDTYMDYIRAQYNRSAQHDPPFFQELLRSQSEREENYTTNLLARIAYRFLDKPLTDIGARVEADRRAYGIYPPKEIYIPTLEDMQTSFSEYNSDAGARYRHDVEHPNEPKQLRDGETPVPLNDGSGRVSISGQTAVMSINGLLTKVIYDRNPTNDFYVEESFPLDWMFPYLTPYGIIMHINRNEVPEITDEMVRRDHAFWSAYSERLSGNWITYDTTVQQVADFVDKVYIQHDFSGFNGNRRFIRDEQAQKSFSKLRTAIAGIYMWRMGMLGGTPTPKKFVDYVTQNPAVHDRMVKEANFAYMQAFVFCPFSPEVVFRYVNFLAVQGRLGDAITVATTCQKFDPNNIGIADMVDRLRKGAGMSQIEQMEDEARLHPTNFTNILRLASGYEQLGENDKARAILDSAIASPAANASVVLTVAKMYDQLHDYHRFEAAMQRLVQIQPGDPEALYDLAGVQAINREQSEALSNLGRAFTLNDAQRAADSNAPDLRRHALTDPALALLTNLPEFRQLEAPSK